MAKRKKRVKPSSKKQSKRTKAAPVKHKKRAKPIAAKQSKRAGMSEAFYQRALKGDKENLGLQSVASEFRKIGKHTTTAQRGKITRAFKELQKLTAQPVFIYTAKKRTKKKEKAKELEKLRKVQKVSQGETKTKFDVAFVPFVPRKLKSGKYSKPRIRVGKKSVTVDNVGYSKTEILLDQVALVENAKAEILAAIAAEAPNAQRFRVVAGKNEMPGAMFDRAGIVKSVISLMNRYDGIKQLPRGSGNAGDAPELHTWDLWLYKLVGYKFDKVSQKAVAQAANEFDRARIALQKKRRADRERARYHAKKNKR